jgi:6-phosphogluconolactonase
MTNIAFHFKEFDWPEMTVNLIQGEINSLLLNQERCCVMLTGGRSAKLLYQAWNKNIDFSTLNNVDFYFGDERSVSPQNSKSNYCMVMKYLFKNKIPGNCRVYRMEAENPCHQDAIKKYESILPNRIDILLLSLGVDGHIASLFPSSDALESSSRMVSSVLAPISPKRRLTITPKLIQSTRQIYILAIGPEKKRIYNEIVSKNPKALDTPGVLALRGVWIFDYPSCAHS